MATRIRLRRMGQKRKPTYRIVVSERTAARDGRFIETVGHYDPRTDPATVEVKHDRARYWIENGATPSDTVRSLLKRAGVFDAAPAEPAAAEPAASE